MDAILHRLIGNNFSELAGLTVDASIPLSEHLINEFIESALQGNKNIADCYVAISGGNKITINLKTPLWLWPINLQVRLERSVDFSGDPKIRASLENNALLGKLGSLFKALPDGVTIEDSLITVDIQSLLKTPEQRRMLALIKSVEIRTQEAEVIFDIKIEVE